MALSASACGVDPPYPRTTVSVLVPVSTAVTSMISLASSILIWSPTRKRLALSTTKDVSVSGLPNAASLIASVLGTSASSSHPWTVDRAARAGSPSASSSGVSCGELIATRSLTSSAISGSGAPAE